MPIHRRTFFVSAAGVLGAYAAPPSETIRLGLIGAGGRGTFVMSVFQKDPSVKVGAICDVYEPNLERGLSAASKAGSQARAYRNYKHLLDDKDIDAVLIATPEHWHARMVLDALAAGKDVYVEKPLCQTPEQGVELVEAEEKSKNIIQVGMQRRSYDLYLEGRKIVASGALGNVRMVRSWWLEQLSRRDEGDEARRSPRLGAVARPCKEACAARPRSVPQLARTTPIMPAASRGSRRARFRWHSSADECELSLRCDGFREQPHREGFDTPETAVATAEYPEDFIATFQVNYAAMRYKSRNDQLNQLDGDKARMDIGREDCNVYPLRSGRHSVDHEKVRTWLRVCDRSARSKLPRMRSYPQDTDSADAARLSGGARRTNGQSIASARQACAVE